jgi:cytochrome c2
VAAYSQSSVRTGWAIAIIAFVQSVLTNMLPRTDKTLPLREDLRYWHVLIGLILFVLLIIRLRNWWREERAMAPTDGLRPGLFNWGRTLALGGATRVGIPGLLTFPAVMGENYRLWLFSGYFHSAVGFMGLVLYSATLLTAAYGWLRYGKGLLTALPLGFGAQALLAMTNTSYALATFKSPEPGPMAVARFLGVVAIVWAIGWFVARRRKPVERAAEPQGRARWAAALGALALVLIGSYGPYAMFRVSPFPMGDVIAGPSGVTSYAAPVVRVQAWAETEFERKVASDTYKWCGFCHTYNKGGKTKAGPNLHAIFGQRIASVPNFHYSPALAAMRGKKWDDATLDAFLADSDKFAPGTTMIISSGPVVDPKVRRAVINMLKRDTMPGAVDMVAAPEGQ